MPTAEAKSAAWRIVADNVEAAQVQLAAADGFARAGQGSAASRLRRRTTSASIATFMDPPSGWVCPTVTTLFPSEEISAEALARVDEWRRAGARPDATPPDREGRDSMARSLRARAVDAARS